jgi:hypothetical protein
MANHSFDSYLQLGIDPQLFLFDKRGFCFLYIGIQLFLLGSREKADELSI